MHDLPAGALSPAMVQMLQRSVGNAAVNRLLRASQQPSTVANQEEGAGHIGRGSSPAPKMGMMQRATVDRGIVQRHAITEDPQFTAAMQNAAVPPSVAAVPPLEEKVEIPEPAVAAPPSGAGPSPEEDADVPVQAARTDPDPAALQRHTAAGAPSAYEDAPRGAMQRNGIDQLGANVGIAKQKTIDKYTKRMKKAIGKGNAAIARDQFKNSALVPALQEALQKHKVVPPMIEVSNQPGSLTGMYTPGIHRIDLSAHDFPDPLTPDQARTMVHAGYHEARHAEQYTAMARYIAVRENLKSVGALRAWITMPDGVLQHVLDVTARTKGFDKKNKQEWARQLYAATIKPNQQGTVSGLYAAMSDEEIAGQDASKAVDAREAVLVAQAQAFADMPGHYPKASTPGVTVPLSTASWSATGIAAVQPAWQPCLTLLQKHAQSLLRKAYDTATLAEKIELFEYLAAMVPHAGPTLQAYVDAYRAALKQELLALPDERVQARARYKALKTEKDAWAVHERVEAIMNKP